MKISKLFHWLYSILMLMPIFFLLFGCINVIHNNGTSTTNDMFNILSLSLTQLSYNNLISWTVNSMPYTAISYIMSIFNCNYLPLTMLLTYWLCISFCWLVFDILMYVPLLCHRWIDKGIKE